MFSSQTPVIIIHKKIFAAKVKQGHNCSKNVLTKQFALSISSFMLNSQEKIDTFFRLMGTEVFRWSHVFHGVPPQ